MAAEQAAREQEDQNKVKGNDELENVPTRDRPLI